MDITADELLDVTHKAVCASLIGVPGAGLVPSFVIITPDGKFSLVSTPWHDDLEKRILYQLVKKRMADEGAVGYSHVTEAWIARAPETWKSGDSIDVLPRECPDRLEVVIAVAKIKGVAPRMRSWLIKRDEKDVVTALDLFDGGGGGQPVPLQGRIFSMLDEDTVR